jgi:hypothetical protein
LDIIIWLVAEDIVKCLSRLANIFNTFVMRIASLGNLRSRWLKQFLRRLRLHGLRHRRRPEEVVYLGVGIFGGLIDLPRLVSGHFRRRQF